MQLSTVKISQATPEIPSPVKKIITSFQSLPTKDKATMIQDTFFRCPLTNQLMESCIISLQQTPVIGLGQSLSQEAATKHHIAKTIPNLLANTIFNNLENIISQLDKQIIPNEFLCPVTHNILQHPIVTVPYGTTYEKDTMINMTSHKVSREPLLGKSLPNNQNIAYLEDNLLVQGLINFCKDVYPFLKK